MFYINVLLGIVRAINWTVVTSDSTISLPIALSPWFCRSVVKGMCLLYTLYINFIDSLVLRLREKLDWWLSRWTFLFSKQCTQIASCVWKCIYACIIIFIKKKTWRPSINARCPRTSMTMTNREREIFNKSICIHTDQYHAPRYQLKVFWLVVLIFITTY